MQEPQLSKQMIEQLEELKEKDAEVWDKIEAGEVELIPVDPKEEELRAERRLAEERKAAKRKAKRKTAKESRKANRRK